MRTKIMDHTDKLMCGVVGTAVSAAGTGLAINEIQAIVSIIITIAGFIISVLIPLIMKLIHKIKVAREDGKLSKEEVDDIASTVKEIVDESSKVIGEVSDKKSEGDKE